MIVVFSLSDCWWIRIRGLWKFPYGRDWLRGKLGLVLMGRAMLSKSLIQFSVEGESCVPSLLLTWGQTMVEVMKIMVTSFKRSHACTSTLSDSNPAAGHHQPTSLVETPGYSQASLGQSLVGSLLLSPGFWCTRFCCALQESISQSCVNSGSSMLLLLSHFSHLTLCDPIDSSPPSSPIPGILQARTLEWVVISFSKARKWKVKVKSLSHVWPSATPWTAAFQAPPSTGFSRQEYWSGVPLAALWYGLMATSSKTLMLGKIEGGRRRGQQRMR